MEVPATRSVPRSERAVPSPAARFVLVVTTAAAAALAAALAVRAVWWAPLNVDEELTRRIASEPLGTIFHVVSTQRGGGPLHFWLEHFTLRWPGGLVGLRVPSLLFLIAALPAVVPRMTITILTAASRQGAPWWSPWSVPSAGPARPCTPRAAQSGQDGWPRR